MDFPTVYWDWDDPTDTFTLFLMFPNDMEVDATPPVAVWDISAAGAPWIPTWYLWQTNHELRIVGDLVADPTPPPDITIALPIFHRDLRYEYGTVYNAFTDVVADPLP